MTNHIATTTTFALDIREVAHFLLAHAELPTPYVSYDAVTWYVWWGENGRSIPEEVDHIRRQIGGTWAKNDPKDDDRNYILTREQKIGHLTVTVHASRSSVCERVKTGTKTIVVPAKPATEEEVIEVEEFGWQCIPLNTHANQLA